jgi:hypothetical protein
MIDLSLTIALMYDGSEQAMCLARRPASLE